MGTIRVEINTQDSCWWLFDKLDSWKNYVGVEDFDETFVINRNKGYKEIQEASWYEKATMLLKDIDCFYDLENVDNFSQVMDEYSLTKEQLDKIKVLYDKCRCTEDIEVSVLNIMFPESEFKEKSLSGYAQSEWQYVIYDSKKVTDEQLELLDAFYFGKIAEISVFDGDDCVSDVITNDKLWELNRNDDVEKYIRETFEIDDSDEVEIYESDGVVQTTKWKKIN